MADWQPSPYSCLCSAHFEPQCFHQRLGLGLEVSSNITTKRLLYRSCAIPTIDTVEPDRTPHPVSQQERRQTLRDASFISAQQQTCEECNKHKQRYIRLNDKYRKAKGVQQKLKSKKLENQAQDLQQHVEQDEDMNAVDETIEESADYDGATLEPVGTLLERRRNKLIMLEFHQISAAEILSGYVGNIKEILFSKSEKEYNAIKKKYAAKVPPPLNTQFPDRTAKDESIKQQRKRKQKEAELFPSGTIDIYP
ncbi:THAP domain-containing 3-like [Paramuricea clavata]|uniref:THAP domain-containing 3-like n=1 Tax=Paramuricea clavata TaxID=317549 RepID=A0A7D9EHJ3_PARCT|nr:THAP domain-containing 3-like [Paramuricea clavata]